jgi:XTP/dITP diphosphohydrolase
VAPEVTRLVLATANPNKVTELAELLAALPRDIEVLARPQWVAEVAETGTTFEANADLKAVAVAGAVGEWALADDSGLEVDALGGAPGVRSARYAADLAALGDTWDGTGNGVTAESEDEANRRALAAKLASRPGASSDRSRFRCALSLADPTGKVWLRADGVVEGRVVTTCRGENGFGYDPMFVPDDGDGATFAEMSRAEKASISHRGRALTALIRTMASHGWPAGMATPG